MLLDAFTNSYLGSRNSRDGEKAKAINKILRIYIYNVLLEVR